MKLLVSVDVAFVILLKGFADFLKRVMYTCMVDNEALANPSESNKSLSSPSPPEISTNEIIWF